MTYILSHMLNSKIWNKTFQTSHWTCLWGAFMHGAFVMNSRGVDGRGPTYQCFSLKAKKIRIEESLLKKSCHQVIDFLTWGTSSEVQMYYWSLDNNRLKKFICKFLLEIPFSHSSVAECLAGRVVYLGRSRLKGWRKFSVNFFCIWF